MHHRCAASPWSSCSRGAGFASLRIAILILVAATITACSDSPTAPTSDSSADTLTHVPDVPLAENTYNPVALGDSWTYVGTHPYTVRYVADTLFDGYHFYVVTSDRGDVQYIRYDSGAYYSRQSLDSGPETLFVRDDLPLGGTWSTTRLFGTTVNYYEYELVDSGATRVVEGHTYTDVAQFHVKDYVVTAVDTLPLFNGDYYFARGVGQIEVKVPNQLWIRLSEYSLH